MDTFITYQGIAIDLQMSEKPFEIPGRGFVHIATLLNETPTDDLGKLKGLELWGEKVIGVEFFATVHQPAGRNIGLLLPKKLW